MFCICHCLLSGVLYRYAQVHVPGRAADERQLAALHRPPRTRRSQVIHLDLFFVSANARVSGCVPVVFRVFVLNARV
jgi:hypothetical protein